MMPSFSFSAFVSAALDFLGAHPLAFGVVVLAALIVAYECWLTVVADAALQKVLRDAAKREDHAERLREDVLRAIYKAKS